MTDEQRQTLHDALSKAVKRIADDLMAEMWAMGAINRARYHLLDESGVPIIDVGRLRSKPNPDGGP